MSGLDNSDFRKLLETPRAERWGNQTPSNKPQATPKPKQAGEQKPHRPRPGGFKKPADKGKAEEEEDDGTPKYRDRAEERRRGKNVDYEDASAVLSALAGDGGRDGGGGGGGGGELGGSVDLSKLSEEETKYLGGDMRFTHLVKGLDYALLHKTRSDVTKGEEGEEDGAGEDGADPPDARARAASRAAAAAAGGPAGRPAAEALRFTTPLARSVYSTLFTAPRSNVKEMYQPRRTAFVYDFDNEDVLDTDIPTTLRRPKSECPPVADALFAGMDTAVLDRIARILSYVRTTADGKRLKRRDRDALLGIKADPAELQQAAAGGGTPASLRAATPAPSASGRTAPVDEDDDIFGDAGTDYKPTSKGGRGKDAAAARDQGAAAKDQAAGARRADGSYFDSKDTMADILMPGTSLRGRAAPAAAAGAGGGGDDMDLEEGEAPPPPPPPPLPPAGGAQYGAQGAAAAAQYGGVPYDGQPQYDEYGVAYGAAGSAYAAVPGAYSVQYPAEAPAAAANAYGTAEEPRWRSSRPKDPKARAVDPEADEDAYAECYPGMAGFVGALVDSDDEGGGDLSHMDSKQAAKGKTRADFTTDEEWQKHKETRETLPRAAFQYGVKRADGRKSHKELEKGAVVESKQRDQKLDGQLRKIKTLLTEKGHEHEGAFARPPKEAGEEGGRGGGRGGGGGGGASVQRGDETPSVFRKRQRI